jgi:hypothetical protein
MASSSGTGFRRQPERGMRPVSLMNSFVGLEALSRYLGANGWKNRIHEGAIEVVRRRVVRISMRVGGSMWFAGRGPTLRVGPFPVYASHALPVQVRYALDVDPAKDPESFRGKLTWDREGVLALGDINKASFEGGSSCERLNGKPARVLALARCMRRFERLRLEPDVANAQVRVVHQQKMRLRFSLIGSEMFDVERNFPRLEFFAALEWLATELERRPRKKKPIRRRRHTR